MDHIARDATRGISEWMGQKGSSVSDSRYSDADSEESLQTHLLLRIREWNILLAACSTVFVFVLLRVLFDGGLLAPFLGTLVYAAHPFVIEHSHYAETDAAMIAMGALSFLLAAMALRHQRPWLLFFAAAVAGFTISMKFSYLLFLVTIPLASIVLARRMGWHWPRVMSFAVASLMVILIGYVAGTPMLILAPVQYFSLSQTENKLVFSENAAVLKLLADEPFPNLLVKGRAMLVEAARLGWGWWLWMAAVAPLWFTRRVREQWTVVPLFGLVYAPLAFLTFPWFRQQEYLPMLPFLAATCALPLAICRRGTVKTATLIAVIACAASTFRDGLRVSSSFAQVETRNAERDWLALCAPSDRLYGVENYAETGNAFSQRPVLGAPASVRHIDKVERHDIGAWNSLGLNYFLRTPSRSGRVVIDPRTGRRFPLFQQRFEEILSRSVLLKTWQAAPDNRPKFSQYTIELHAALDHVGMTDIPCPPPMRTSPPPLFIHGGPFCSRPIRISNDVNHLGPVEVLMLTRRPASAAFDPLPEGRHYYAIALNLAPDENATVSWSRGFAPRRATIPPRGAALFTSTKGLASLWRTIPTSSVRSNRAGQSNLILVAVTADASIAKDILRRHGAIEAADEIGQRLDGNGLSTEQAIPWQVRDDFSRLWTGPFAFAGNVKYPGSIPNMATGHLWAEFPVVLERGSYSLRVFLTNDARLTKAACGGDPARAPVPSFRAVGAQVLSAKPVDWANDGSLAYDIELEAFDFGIPFLLGIAVDKGVFSIDATGAEFRWHPDADKTLP